MARAREILATIYLRRGFLESAADEWIAALRAAGPDRAAGAGLAEVARGSGLDEEAELFLREARLSRTRSKALRAATDLCGCRSMDGVAR